MSKNRLVKDVMFDVFGYPHVPYWFSLKNVLNIIKVSFFTNENNTWPVAVLVFDHKYNLLGIVTQMNLLKGLEPHVAMHVTIKEAEILAEIDQLNIDALMNFETTLFTEKMGHLLERPVSEIMSPIKVFLSPEDPVLKAAFLMAHKNMTIIPVLEDQKKLVGLIRITDVFKEILAVISSK